MNSKIIFINILILFIIIVFIVLILSDKKKDNTKINGKKKCIIKESFNNYSDYQNTLKSILSQTKNTDILKNSPLLKGQTQNLLNNYDTYNSFKEINNNTENKNKDKDKDKNSIDIKNKKHKKKNIIINKSITENSCKYFSSYDSKFKCPTEYKISSGASIGINEGVISCNGQVISNKTSIAEGIIKNGSIEKIIIIESGNNYKNIPTIEIIGDGELASAECSVSNGKVNKIIITNPGKNYSYPPKIQISKPDGMIYCHLCCKDLNIQI
jgi:hypothetical protein